MVINGAFRYFFMNLFRIFPLKKKIVFSSFLGKRYGGVPKEVYDQLKNERNDIEFVWLLNKRETIEGAKIVPYLSLKSLYHLATAEVWIDDVRKGNWVRKRKGQFYIQTWHGSGPCIKKIELDAVDYLDPYYVKSLINDSKIADIFISACEWRTQNIRTAFGYHGRIIKCSPAIKKFCSIDFEITKNVKKELGIPYDMKVLLYAPTFRKDESISAYNIDYERILNALIKRDKTSWCIVIRLHPNVLKLQSLIKYNEFIINASSYGSFEKLLISCDAFITDYSGTLFQAVYLNKETYIYANDYDVYIQQNRDLYFNLEAIGPPVVKSNEELEKAIFFYNYNKNLYCDKMIAFNHGIGYYNEEGDIVQVICKYINDVMKGE